MLIFCSLLIGGLTPGTPNPGCCFVYREEPGACRRQTDSLGHLSVVLQPDGCSGSPSGSTAWAALSRFAALSSLEVRSVYPPLPLLSAPALASLPTSLVHLHLPAVLLLPTDLAPLQHPSQLQCVSFCTQSHSELGGCISSLPPSVLHCAVGGLLFESLNASSCTGNLLQLDVFCGPPVPCCACQGQQQHGRQPAWSWAVPAVEPRHSQEGGCSTSAPVLVVRAATLAVGAVPSTSHSTPAAASDWRRGCQALTLHAPPSSSLPRQVVFPGLSAVQLPVGATLEGQGGTKAPGLSAALPDSSPGGVQPLCGGPWGVWGSLAHLTLQGSAGAIMMGLVRALEQLPVGALEQLESLALEEGVSPEEPDGQVSDNMCHGWVTSHASQLGVVRRACNHPLVLR